MNARAAPPTRRADADGKCAAGALHRLVRARVYEATPSVGPVLVPATLHFNAEMLECVHVCPRAHMTHDAISCPGYKSEKKIDLEMKDPDNPDERYKPQQPHRTAPTTFATACTCSRRLLVFVTERDCTPLRNV